MKSISSVRMMAILALSLFVPTGYADDAQDLSSNSASAEPAVVDWTFRLPDNEFVTYQGEVSFDTAGTAAHAMLYPAPGAIGLLAAVATHAIVEGSIRSSQKTKLQEAADKVLEPYRAVLSSFSQRQLFEQAITCVQSPGPKTIVSASQDESEGRLVDITPAFSLTQDQSAIVLEATVAIFEGGKRGDGSNPKYKNVVKVVSQSRDQPDLAGYWTANQGEQLKTESAHLLAESIDLAIADMTNMGNEQGSQPPSYKTIRYQDGKSEKMERGQPLNEGPERTVLKTLRGWLMSVPTQHFLPVAPSTPATVNANSAATPTEILN